MGEVVGREGGGLGHRPTASGSTHAGDPLPPQPQSTLLLLGLPDSPALCVPSSDHRWLWA